MKKRAIVCITVLMSFTAVTSSQESPGSVPSAPPSVTDLGQSRVNAIVLAAREVSPAVVSISVIQTRYYRSSPFRMDDFFGRFFDDFFAPRIYERQVESLGSGFLISSDGYILTNEHVVREAEKIKVTLPDGREFDAGVAGKDAALDLTLLRIDGSDLPFAPLGDSDDLIIGEWAIAIGNPFGYLLEDAQPSVTAGVISAVNRDIKPRGGWRSSYKDMIQTDASINPGNSGGPLVNAEGQVIGINTFIFTAGGGSEGIGFAIPINLVKKITEELVQFGKVREVWLGIDVQEITPEIARTISQDQGVLVVDVAPGGEGEDAGVEVGDVVVELAGRKVRNPADWSAAVSALVVGEETEMTVRREDQSLVISLVAKEPPVYEGKKSERFGLVVQEITPYLKSKLRIDADGVVVVEVKPRSPGEGAGVRVGDVIMAIGNERCHTVEEFEKIADGIRGGRLSLHVNRGGVIFYLSSTSIW